MTTDDAATRRPRSLDDEAALDDLLEAEDRVLVEFYTEGCSACAAMEPVLGNVARETEVTVAVCNPRDDPPLVDRFQITSVPALVAFENGEEVGRLADGFQGVEAVLAFLEESF
ncbi:thioredoxin family protein [Haloarculaceae archaeon H-GB2-1]|nr:thioredoxin family protein [Haloarculaceae archaeon H-GB1-1]MEA5406351.1 thioredoxin family protein [Haloarculaceae archaeon H-GB2-1]